MPYGHPWVARSSDRRRQPEELSKPSTNNITADPHESASNSQADLGVLAVYDNSKISFLDLSAEIRLFIYEILTYNIRIFIRSHWGLKKKACISWQGQSFAGFMMSCKRIYAEMTSHLRSSSATLCITSWHHRTQRPAMFEIPTVWRDRIKTIEVPDIHREIPLYLPHFTNLRNIAIGMKAYHIVEPEGSFDGGNEAEERLRATILRKIRHKDTWLEGHGSTWIEDADHVQVTLRALVYDQRWATSHGWIAEVDVTHWKVSSAVKADFTRLPYNEPLRPGMLMSNWFANQRRWFKSIDSIGYSIRE